MSKEVFFHLLSASEGVFIHRNAFRVAFAHYCERFRDGVEESEVCFDGMAMDCYGDNESSVYVKFSEIESVDAIGDVFRLNTTQGTFHLQYVTIKVP
jgi:hypothetical protein